MAAAAPVRPFDLHNNDRPGNCCPICQEWQAPDWRGKKGCRRQCCGVIICMPCWGDWEGVRNKVMKECGENFQRGALAKMRKRHDKKMRAWVRGEKFMEEAKAKKKSATGEKKKEEKKKLKLEKLLDRHTTCPSCRAPLAMSDEGGVAQLRRNAERGRSWAQCMLGVRYRDGVGVRKDARQAERWYRAAMMGMSVLDGGPQAAYELGKMYVQGDGVRKDVEEAKKLFTMAHEAGHFLATTNLGVLFKGRCGPAAGVPDHEKAATLCHQAAEAGQDQAQVNLGVCYYNGEGVEQDKEKAKAWYAKAAKQGHATAMYNLAIVLHETEGAAAMPASMALTRAAGAKGDVDAKKDLPRNEEAILSICASCGKPRADMAEDPKRCNRCFAAAYCSQACQKQHWKKGGHKKACNERKKYLPEKEGGGE